MVGFGKSIVNARRDIWKDAYIDYNLLKRIVEEIEDALTERNSTRQEEDEEVIPLAQSLDSEDPNNNNADNDSSSSIEHLKSSFFSQLELQIEKLSLFTLRQQGKLADAIGALRFNNNNNKNNSDSLSLFDNHNSLLLLQNGNNTNNSSNEVDVHVFSSLGVELLHLLKFICVNSIGIRKILKKYNKVIERLDEPHYYSVMSGDHLQQLAYARSMAAIQSSLQSAAAELLVGRIHSNISSARHQDTTSSTDTTEEMALLLLSLYRFQCVMGCSDMLKRNADILQQPFWDFLSRRAMIVTGANLGGMEGSGKQSLVWLLSLNPDDMLTMNHDQLEALWNRWSFGPTIATTTKNNDGVDRCYNNSSFVSHLPLLQRQLLHEVEAMDDDTNIIKAAAIAITNDKKWGGVNAASMTLNLLSTLLYTVNYYIVAPTANHYAIQLKADGAFGATLIGASSFSALFAAFFYSFWYTKSSFKSALIVSSVCPVIGNLIYALAISYNSMSMAIGGRILCGFGSAEVVNRQLISACVNFDGMTQASALFVAAGALGMSVGPLLAGILEMLSGRDSDIDIHLHFLPSGGIILNHVTTPGYLMAILWLCELVALLIVFQEPVRINNNNNTTNKGVPPRIATDVETNGDDNNNKGGAASTNEEGNRLLLEQQTVLPQQYDTIPAVQSSMRVVEKTGRRPSMSNTISISGILREVSDTGKLIVQNPALPVTVLLFGYIEMADEVLISSASMVVRRYFGWHGSVAGFLIASLGALVLPAHFVVEKASHYLSERRIVFRSLVFLLVALLGIFNWSGLVYDVIGVFEVEVSNPKHNNNNHKESIDISNVRIGHAPVGSLLTDKGEFPYDYGSGPTIYIFFLSMVFMGTIVLEGVDTSIMAKVTPSELNDRFLNCGLLATLVGTLGRVFADGMITMSALVGIHVFVDFVNATFFPLFILALAGMYVVNKYYKSLV